MCGFIPLLSVCRHGAVYSGKGFLTWSPFSPLYRCVGACFLKIKRRECFFEEEEESCGPSVWDPPLQVTWLSCPSLCFTWIGKEWFLPPEVLQQFHSINSLWPPPQAHITIPSGFHMLAYIPCLIISAVPTQPSGRLHSLIPWETCVNYLTRPSSYDQSLKLHACDCNLTSQHFTRSVSSCAAGITRLVWHIDTEKRAGNNHPSIHHVPCLRAI